jgi:hypothetical protein
MKAITLEQPFASLVSIGVKTIETVPWTTDYRGLLAIHSAESVVEVADPYYRSLLLSAGVDCEQLPSGKIIAIGRLASCEKVIKPNVPCYPELAFSDFTPGLYALGLADIRILATPVPAIGGRGLWDWQEESAEASFGDNNPDRS